MPLIKVQCFAPTAAGHIMSGMPALMRAAREKKRYPSQQDATVYVSRDKKRYMILSIEEDEDPDMFYLWKGVVGPRGWLSVRGIRIPEGKKRAYIAGLRKWLGPASQESKVLSTVAQNAHDD